MIIDAPSTPIKSNLARKIAKTEIGKTLFTKGELDRFAAMDKGLPFPDKPTYRIPEHLRMMNFMQELEAVATKPIINGLNKIIGKIFKIK